MKLIQTYNYGSSNNIFALIAHADQDIITPEIAKVLDTEYYLGRSGNKEITPFFENLIAMKEAGTLVEEPTTIIANYLVSLYKESWLKYKTALSKTYDPLLNHKFTMTEDRAETGSKTGTESSEREKHKTDDVSENLSLTNNQTEQLTVNDDTTNKTQTKTVETTSQESSDESYGFNSTTSVPVGNLTEESIVTTIQDPNDNVTVTENDRTDTGTINQTKTEDNSVTTSIDENISDTITYNLTDKDDVNITRTTEGKMGHKDYAELIQTEIDMRIRNLYFLRLQEDVDKVLCQSVYKLY